MTWYAAKDTIDRRLAETFSVLGYEARAEWSGRKGVVKCGNPGHGSWNFEVHVALDVAGGAGIDVRSIYDTNEGGKAVDIVTGEPVPERSFSFRAGDTVGLERFLRAVRKETMRWAEKRAAYEESLRRDGGTEELAEALGELIGRDPENAARAIADVLGENLQPGQAERLAEAVREANRQAPAP